MRESSGKAFSEVLKHERKRRGWSQADVAEKVGTDPNTVSRWERGLNVPGPFFIQKLCDVFEKTPEAFGLFHTGLEQIPDESSADDKEAKGSSTSLPLSLSSVSFSTVHIPQASVQDLAQPQEAQTKHVSQSALPTGTVTLLFTDIEGSTRLLQHLGRQYGSILAECRSLLRTIFQTYNGYEVDTQGDAFFVAFARATDAVSAAVAAQQALNAHPWPQEVIVRIRMGLHTGEPSCVAEGYVGLDVHQAARIMSAGHGGQILLSHTALDLVEHSLPEGVRVRALGEHRLKDLQHPVHLFQLVMAGLPADFPPLKTLDSSPNNLPVQPTPFIGREKEVAAVVELLNREQVHLLTLTGAGGTGKTRLALHVAAELSEAFTDGVFFVNLAPLRDPQFVLPAIAQTLNIQEEGEPFLFDLLKAFLQEKHMLLLLDNFEQVVQAASEVAALLGACPKLKMVVTSRMVLNVRIEQEFVVPPLTLPDLKHLPDLVALSQYAAVALFILRAQTVKFDFHITNATAPAIAQICVRLDGLPLAIELAAARIKLFSPPVLLSRLNQRLNILTGGARDAPVRQQTLRNTLAWSYELLEAGEQLLFRRLSIFVGGATLEAIEALYTILSDEPDQVLEGIASLIDKSLLKQSVQEGEETRFHMLETVREYGLERLDTLGEWQTVQQAHAHYYLKLAEQAARHLTGAEAEGRGLALLELEYDNLRTALAWMVEGMEKGRVEMAVRLCAVLSEFWTTRGHVNEGRTFLERILGEGREMEVSLQAKALLMAAHLASWQGNKAQGEEYAHEALSLFQALGDIAGSAETLRLLAYVGYFRGDNATTQVMREEAIDFIRKLGDKKLLVSTFFESADWLCMQGEYSQGLALLEECQALFRETGSKWSLAAVLVHSAFWIVMCQGDMVTVRARLDEALPLIKEVGDKALIAEYCHVSSLLAQSEGDMERGLALAEESVMRYREIELAWWIIVSVVAFAHVEARQGNTVAARTHFEESMALCKKIDDKMLVPYILEGLASIAAIQGESIKAVHLLGAAVALREVYCHPMPPFFRGRYEDAVDLARNQLDESVFAAAWAEGKMMTPEQALAAQNSDAG